VKGKKMREASAGQKEMLMPIEGKKPAQGIGEENHQVAAAFGMIKRTDYQTCVDAIREARGILSARTQPAA